MKINDIFKCADGIFPKEALDLCKDGKAYIKEIDPVNGVRRFQIVGVPESTFEEICAAALSHIDSATSAAILAGFEYEMDTGEGKEVLYFSYDSFDQQNFADTANGAMMQMMAIPTSLPTVIEWNGWRNHTAESKGELVKVPLKADQFISLYTEGALAHKAYQMEIGTSRKQKIEACQTVEEINALLSEWGI